MQRAVDGRRDKVRMPWTSRESRSVLSGPVCTFHIVVNMDSESQDRAWQLLGRPDYRTDLQSPMLASAHQTLGPELDVRSMSVTRGSIELFVTVGAIYYALSRYQNFVESIELLASQLAGVVRRFLGNFPMSPSDVSATWEPGPALVRLEALELETAGITWAYPLLWYVILSHAALLSLFIWLLARRHGSRASRARSRWARDRGPS